MKFEEAFTVGETVLIANVPMVVTFDIGNSFSEDVGDKIKTMGIFEVEIEEDDSIIELPFLFDVLVNKIDVIKSTSSEVILKFDKDDILFNVEYLEDEKSLAYTKALFLNSIPQLKNNINAQLLEMSSIVSGYNLKYFELIIAHFYIENGDWCRLGKQNYKTAEAISIIEAIQMSKDPIRSYSAGYITAGLSKSLAHNQITDTDDATTQVLSRQVEKV